MGDLQIPAGMTGRAEIKNLPCSSGLHFAPIVFPNFKCSADAVIRGNRYIVSFDNCNNFNIFAKNTLLIHITFRSYLYILCNKLKNFNMKHFFSLMLISLIGILQMNAQVTEDMYSVKEGKIIVEKVIPFTISKSEASAAVKSYFLTMLNDSNQTLKNSSDDYYVVKIVTPELAFHSMKMWYTRGELTIEVRFKEDRMKVSISCANIINTNIQGTNKKNYNPTEASPINPNHDAWKTNIAKKPAEETFNNLILYMVYNIEELNKVVVKAKDENDW